MKTRVKPDSWLINRPIAHRGLHNDIYGENSISAYRNAIDNGYPIEMDVQLTKDGEVVCFHDDNAKRVCGVDANIRDMTLKEVRALKICGTSDGIMTFNEFLKFVDGRVPVLVEIKQQHVKNSGIEAKTVMLLDGYKGEFAIQSFDPRIMRNIRLLRPQFLRGQLGGGVRKGDLPFVQYLAVRKLLLNFLSKPDFINYCIEEFPIKTKLPVMRWTINTEEKKARAMAAGHNIVFEKINP
ncbi:MAG: glycerophosphodiester phosphodiesterase [Christensenellaceae bacterium]|nr:glycerophosphodiester phosphodiesterase [Christensenellaceae bacterium]MDY2850862.1 glycerophosphodiester phosphodiesterase family protein [Christensenellaceae bacterium]